MHTRAHTHTRRPTRPCTHACPHAAHSLRRTNTHIDACALAPTQVTDQSVSLETQIKKDKQLTDMQLEKTRGELDKRLKETRMMIVKREEQTLATTNELSAAIQSTDGKVISLEVQLAEVVADGEKKKAEILEVAGKREAKLVEKVKQLEEVMHLSLAAFKKKAVDEKEKAEMVRSECDSN